MNLLWMIWLLSSAQLQEPVSADRNQNIFFWIDQLKTSSIDLRINALQKISEIKDPRAIPKVIETLNGDNAQLRYRAARSLAKTPTDQSLMALERRFQEEQDVYVKAEIGRSIKAIEAFFEKTKPSLEGDELPSEQQTSEED